MTPEQQSFAEREMQACEAKSRRFVDVAEHVGRLDPDSEFDRAIRLAEFWQRERNHYARLLENSNV